MNTSLFCSKCWRNFARQYRDILVVGSVFVFTLGHSTIFGAVVTKSLYTTVNDSVYNQVDALPYLKGHQKGTSKEIQRNANYPEKLKVLGVEGEVLVSFVVDKKGKVSNAKVENGSHADLGEEAMRAVLTAGDWSPAEVDGKEVASRKTVLVRFKLTDEEKALVNALKPLDLENKPPLYIVDGKVVDGGVQTIDFYNVRSIRVIKGTKATDLYGTRGVNGIVEVTTKNGTPPVK